MGSVGIFRLLNQPKAYQLLTVFGYATRYSDSTLYEHVLEFHAFGHHL